MLDRLTQLAGVDVDVNLRRVQRLVTQERVDVFDRLAPQMEVRRVGVSQQVWDELFSLLQDREEEKARKSSQ